MVEEWDLQVPKQVSVTFNFMQFLQDFDKNVN